MRALVQYSLFSILLLFFTTNLCATETASSTAKEAAGGFEKLQFLLGNWQMQPAQRTAKNPELESGKPYGMVIVPIISNRYLRATGDQDGTVFELTFGYDDKRKLYRLSILDSYTGISDFYKGDFNAAGVLSLENDHGFRLEIVASPGQGWTADNYYSADSGKTWQLYGRHIAGKKQ